MSYKIHHIRLVRRWHARIGVLAVIFLVFLVTSGVALNHTDALKLDKRELRYAWLMQWYGLHADSPQQGYQLGGRYLGWSGGQWLLDGKIIATSVPRTVGAVRLGGIDYVATADGLYLFQPGGQLVDKITSRALPGAPLAALGIAGGRVAVQTPAAVFTSVDGIEWKESGAAAVLWSTMQDLPVAERESMAGLSAPGLPVQRVLLDLHSGRVFGRYGPLLVDMVAIALLTLGLSGLWIYWRSVRQGRLQRSHIEPRFPISP